MSSSAITYKHRYSPDLELKNLLIALRKANDISEEEMARYLGVSKSELIRYENIPKVYEFYMAKYIEGLEEYIACGVARKMSFQKALMIYKKQRCLYKYPISYKLALFGNIYYAEIYADLNVCESRWLEENSTIQDDLNLEDLSGDEKIVEFISEESKEYGDIIWNKEKYQMAFFILKTLREILELKLITVSESIGVSKSILDVLETKTETYHGRFNLRKIVKMYAKFLDRNMKEENVRCTTYELICYFISHDYTERNRVKVMKMIIEKLFKE